MMLPPERTEEQRDELVDRVAREMALPSPPGIRTCPFVGIGIRAHQAIHRTQHDDTRGTLPFDRVVPHEAGQDEVAGGIVTFVAKQVGVAPGSIYRRLVALVVVEEEAQPSLSSK